MNDSIFPLTDVTQRPLFGSKPRVINLLWAAVTMLAWLLVTAPANAQCNIPAPGGNPNGNGCPGIASVPPGGANAGAGNPINVMTGNKYQREDDLPALPGVLGLEIVRHYNSAYSAPGHPNGVLGRGWRLSYETELVDRAGKLQVLQADGGRVIFDRDRKAPTGCSTRNPENGSMSLGRQDGRPDYTWTWTNGRKLHFNHAGKLDRITAPSGEAVRLLYDDQNVLVRVIDPQGRSLNLVYYDRHIPNQFHGVQFIDTPVGRFAYEYGSAIPKGAGLVDQRQLLANLVRVRLPDHFDPGKKAHALSSRGTTRSTTSRVYLHEDPRNPWLMTGIGIETVGADGTPVSTRYATYGYDRAGRAILSTHAGNVDKVTLDNSKAGETVLTNSLGQKTVYRYAVIAGDYRLLEVRGAGCALCGDVNVRYGYDSVGRMVDVTRLADSGEPIATTKTARDGLGRVVRVSKIAYQNGRQQAEQLQVRFEYRGDGFAPVLIARPSVVPGKELMTRIDYNDAGQPLSVSENGWSPTADGRTAAAQIARTVRYRYVAINGRSLLTKIDGPLPNGKTGTPLDSDVTLIEYDRQNASLPPPKVPSGGAQLLRYESFGGHAGIVTAIVAPGNRKSGITYDYAGRIASVKNTEDRGTSLRYSPRGDLLAITRDGITYTTRYDGVGHPVELGYGDGAHYHALARLGYDGAGRNTWEASALGIVTTWRFDTEGALLERSTQSNTIKQSQRYEYDQLGRLRTVTDASGGTRHIGWNARGLPDALTDTLGRTMRFGYDAADDITAVTDAANAATRFEMDAHGRTTAVIAPNGATTRYLRDDFGRIVATIGADSGKTMRHFDAANRMIDSVDANGNRVSYEYDVMGRIVSQRVTDAGNGGKTTATTWRYEGAHLVAIEHPNQSERYGYDEHGRVSLKTVILRLASGALVGYTTRYRYDILGQLVGIGLPDGSTIDYVRNGQNQVTALERRPGGNAWPHWLLPTQPIVRNLERDVVGIKHVTYGNGIEADYQRGKEGALARIVYRDPHMPASREQHGDVLTALLGIRPALAAPATVLPGALGLPPDPKALLDRRYLWDTQGNLLYTRDKETASGYAYDARDQLIVAATGPHPSFARYHYDDNGNRLLEQEGIDQNDIRGNTGKTVYAPASDRWQTAANGNGIAEAHYDATGLPERAGKRSFAWDALGKLLEVRDGQRVLARYRYNHRGERIEKIVGEEHTFYLYENRQLVAELDGNGTIRRQYVYLGGQPVAVIDTPNRGSAHGTADSGFVAGIAELWSAWFGKGESIVYLQTNHLGAVEMATDAKGKPIWQANYNPFGKLMPAKAQAKHGFALNLRLPGQYADNETGLYYNDHRYYDPARGRYLSPDPLGLGGGANGYAYAGGNPLTYVDPKGLVLFAFDGSGNDQHDPKELSNVVNFLNLYQDKKFYITGVGTKDKDTGIAPTFDDFGGIRDIMYAYTGKPRIAAMINNLNTYSDTVADDVAFNIDIVGFSRGAAEGRDFANQIAAHIKDGYYHYISKSNGKEQCQKVTFNFMGLFDTVLSTHTGDYQLGIPDAFKYVAQAMALNEYRDGAVGFPMESIRGAPTPQDTTRIERGFLGAHSDIGGSYPDGELAKVALVWMVDQAKLADVKINDQPSLHTIAANPVLHDKSNNLLHGADTGGPTATSQDRDVRYRNGTVEKQRKTTLGVMSYADTVQFIKYKPNPNAQEEIAGTVDMKGYLQWLNNHGYNINLTIQ
jgi:RHS repeat-associated protein